MTVPIRSFFLPRKACVRFKNVPHYFRFVGFSTANLFEIINNYRKMSSKLQSQKVVWGFAGWWLLCTMQKSSELSFSFLWGILWLYTTAHLLLQWSASSDCWCFCHTYLWRPNYSSGLRVFQLQRFLNHSIFFHLMQHKHKSIWCVMLYIITARLNSGSFKWAELQSVYDVLQRSIWLLTSISFGTVSWQLFCFHVSTHCNWWQPGSRADGSGETNKERRGKSRDFFTTVITDK